MVLSFYVYVFMSYIFMFSKEGDLSEKLPGKEDDHTFHEPV